MAEGQRVSTGAAHRAVGNGTVAPPAYRADIDGLRAVAVLSVVFYHFGVLSGGFAGVDLFFVISGFLIGGQIAEALAAGRFSLTAFYARRIRRILPALFVTLALTLAAASVILFPPDLVRLRPIATATVAFVANLRIAATLGDYSGAYAQASPLLHVWSLAVEEQFYLLFPLLMLGIARLAARRYLPWLVVLAAISFVASVVAARVDPVSGFYLAPFRAWEFLLGALLAVRPLHNTSWRNALALLGLILIGLADLAFNAGTPFPSEFSLLPCGGAALILYANCTPQSLPGRLLVNPVARHLGLWSYSLYLLHWPLLVLTRYYLASPLTPPILALLLAISIGLAALSWKFVEQPFRGRAFSTPRISALAAGVAILLVGASRLLPLLHPGATRDFPSLTHAQQTCWNQPPEIIAQRPACRLGAPWPLRAVLWGDSHARALVPAVAAAFAAHGQSAMIVASGNCPPLMGVQLDRPRPDMWGLSHTLVRPKVDCPAQSTALLSWVVAHKIPAVILAAHWIVYADTAKVPAAVDAHLALHDVRHPDQTDEAAIFAHGLAAMLDGLQSHRVQIFVVEDVPQQSVEVPYAMAAEARLGHPAPLGISRGAYQAQQAVATGILQRLQARYDFTLLRPQDILCASGRCVIAEAGQVLYADNEHLSPAGALKVAPIFAPLWPPPRPSCGVCGGARRRRTSLSP